MLSAPRIGLAVVPYTGAPGDFRRTSQYCRCDHIRTISDIPGLDPILLEQPDCYDGIGLYDGTGSVVWPAGLALCEFLSTPEGRNSIKDKNVIEIGSGTGLVGIACRRLGAKHVCVSDLEEDLPLLRANIARNREVILMNRSGVNLILIVFVVLSLRNICDDCDHGKCFDPQTARGDCPWH